MRSSETREESPKPEMSIVWKGDAVEVELDIAERMS
jgi:hypothetical protein